MSDLIGQSFGQYDIKSVLGRGGMAIVYRATQTSMKRDVAIKIMSSELSGDEEFVSRFEREAQFFAALQHPHILPVIDFGESGENIFIVMRLVEGGGLDELLRKGALSLPQTARMVGQIGGALTFAHQKGIIHRDLKPNNVLLDEDRNTYLTDFGLAKMAEGTTRLTRTDAIMGTPTYMAPEQWTGRDVDFRADIYALGVMTYEMITGQLPFEGDTSYVLMYKHMNEDPVALREHMADLPRAVEDVVMRALAKDPDERYQSAESLANALKDAVEGRSAASTIGVQPRVVDTQKAIAKDTEVGVGLLPDTKTIVGDKTPIPKPREGATVIGTADTVARAKEKIQAAIGDNEDSQTALIPTTRKISPMMIGAAVLGVIAIIVVIGVLVSGGGGSEDTPIIEEVGDVIDLTTIAEDIAYNRSTTESEDIYSMRPDGSGLRFVGTGGKPSWSADGQFIAFDSSFTGDPELFIISADGTEMRNLTNSPDTQEYFASFSPDGTQVVFHSNRGENFDIFVINVDGTDPRPITDNPANDQWPTWSPDGSRIAFTSQRDGNLEIYTMDPDGDNIFRVTENPGADLWVSYSPDGSEMAFQSNRDGNLEIYVMNSDGTNVRRLTNNDADDQWPDWSSNGYIVFSSNRDGNQEIYVIRPDGTGLTRVTNNSTDERFPVWSKNSVDN
ncbi:MAG: protein kinase [Aggregatilineales bacterium]